jgi:hypothetical protein
MLLNGLIQNVVRDPIVLPSRLFARPLKVASAFGVPDPEDARICECPDAPHRFLAAVETARQ